jgi:hypothetical protein
MSLRSSPLVRAVALPLVTVSEANAHGHWRGRQKRALEQRHATYLALRAHLGAPPAACRELKLGVVLVRRATRALDGDNLQGALKAVRDGVADYLGLDDGDPRVLWRYEQQRALEPGVLVRLVPGARPCAACDGCGWAP